MSCEKLNRMAELQREATKNLLGLSNSLIPAGHEFESA